MKKNYFLLTLGLGLSVLLLSACFHAPEVEELEDPVLDENDTIMEDEMIWPDDPAYDPAIDPAMEEDWEYDPAIEEDWEYDPAIDPAMEEDWEDEMMELEVIE